MITYRYETGIIVKLLTDNSAFAQCDLRADEFGDEQLRTIYQAIETLIGRGDAVNWLTVAEYLINQGAPDFHGLLASLLAETPAVSDLEVYVTAVRRGHEIRKAQDIGDRLVNDSAQEGVIDSAIRDLMTLSMPAKRYDYSLNAAIKLAADEIDQAYQGKVIGLTTGLMDLDSMLGGLHGGDLVIIGARPAMGKTALMLNMALAALLAGNNVGIFSGEQGVAQIGQRLLAIQGRVPIMRMRNGNMHEEDLTKLSAAGNSLQDRGLMIFDKPAPTLSDIVRKARHWCYTQGTKAIYLDYLQRVKTTSKAPRHEAIGEIAAGLKELARELNVPLVVLAQVNREVEKRTNKRPLMGDLKDSGTIEQEADQIFMLYRDEVYHDDTKDKGLAEISIEKNRHGKTGRVDLVWKGECLRFENRKRAVA
jgi:replicative DNA helicase